MTSIIQSWVDFEGDAFSDEKIIEKVFDLYKYSFKLRGGFKDA